MPGVSITSLKNLLCMNYSSNKISGQKRGTLFLSKKAKLHLKRKIEHDLASEWLE
jgi:hypothetical protein